MLVAILGLHVHVEKLRRPVGGFSLGPYLSDPRVLGRWFLGEHIDLVVAHSFLSHNDLLGPIDDEVAALVKATIFSILDPLHLIELL